MTLTGNTIVVTGGTSGIGRALVERFVGMGNKVVTCGRRQDRLESYLDGFLPPLLLTGLMAVGLTALKFSTHGWSVGVVTTTAVVCFEGDTAGPAAKSCVPRRRARNAATSPNRGPTLRTHRQRRNQRPPDRHRRVRRTALSARAKDAEAAHPRRADSARRRPRRAGDPHG